MTSADDAEHIRNLGRRIRNLETSLGAACNEVDETRTRLAEAERLLQRAIGFGLGGSWEHEADEFLSSAGERGLAAENVQNQTVPAANPSGAFDARTEEDKIEDAIERKHGRRSAADFQPLIPP